MPLCNSKTSPWYFVPILNHTCNMFFIKAVHSKDSLWLLTFRKTRFCKNVHYLSFSKQIMFAKILVKGLFLKRKWHSMKARFFLKKKKTFCITIEYLINATLFISFGIKVVMHILFLVQFYLFKQLSQQCGI